VKDYPWPDWLGQQPSVEAAAIPLQIATVDGTLTFISASTRFGAAVDVTLSEISIESFLPADRATAEYLRRPAAGRGRVAGASAEPAATMTGPPAAGG
jgi:hypothetical protein